MTKLEEDPFIGTFFDTPEKKARWIVIMKIIYIIWIVFVITGIMSLFFCFY